MVAGKSSPGVEVAKAAIEDSYTRLMVPLVTIHFRNELKKMVEKALLEVISFSMADQSDLHQCISNRPIFFRGF